VTTYEDKKRALGDQIRRSAGEVRLQKNISHIFRDRHRPPAAKLDVRKFDQVLAVDTAAGTVDVEGMTPYAKLADATFAHGVLPAVVPQLKSITIGGACAGLGIESSSFRYGLAHETVQEMEVLLPDGDIVVCTPTNNHSDLFFGLPNSFGTLGYALRVRAKTVPAKKYVELTHIRYSDPAVFLRELEAYCGRADVDFVDGVVFERGEHYLVVGRFVEAAPYTSDYTYMNIFYRSIRERERDYLTALDYIWRWDTDWFWCSRLMYVQNPIIRRLMGKKRLNSIFYKKVMDWNFGYSVRRVYRKLFDIHQETVIQDVDVKVERGPEFLDFFQREIGLTPVWICPFKAYNPKHRYPLFPTDPKALYVNFGFWDSKFSPEGHPPGHFNRLIEKKLAELGGIKSLYSDSFYPEDEFYALFGGETYAKLKAKYDPNRRLSDLYRKCVLRQ
jgi:FAD/FMN-containing dehydrogenase